MAWDRVSFAVTALQMVLVAPVGGAQSTESVADEGTPNLVRLALLVAGLVFLVLAVRTIGARTRRSRRASVTTRAAAQPVGPADIIASAFGVASLSAFERDDHRLVAVLLFPTADTAATQTDLRAAVTALLDEAGRAAAATTPAALVALSDTLLEVCGELATGGGVLIVDDAEARYATCGSVGVSIEGPSGRRTLLTTEGPFVTTRDPSDEVFAVFGGRARTIFAGAYPIPGPEEPDADAHLHATATLHRNHPFVIVSRTRRG